MSLVPAILIEGFISAGKTTLVHQLLQEKKRFAFVFDSDVLPDTILYGFEDAKVLREDVAIEILDGTCVCCTLDEDNIEEFLLPRFKDAQPPPFDNVVFVNNSFESSFLAELLTCVDEGILSTLASKVNLLNIVCLLDCASALVNLKSTQLLNERFKSEFEDVAVVASPDSNTTDGAYNPSANTASVAAPVAASTNGKLHLTVPLTPAALAASLTASLSGSLAGSRKKTVCCPYQGEENCCQRRPKVEAPVPVPAPVQVPITVPVPAETSESSTDKLVKKGDKPVSTLVFEQLTCASIVVLNKIDLIEEDEVEFLENLVKLINPNVKVLRSELAKINSVDELFAEPSLVVKNYQPVEKKMSGVFITHFYQRVPFHPERLFKFLYADAEGKKISKSLSSILYLNGFIWLATDMKFNYSFEVSTGYDSFTYGSKFFSAMSENEWPVDPAIKESIERDIKLFKFQDRKTEISIVGIESKTMTQAKFIEQLSKCLLTEQELELGPNQWETTFKNPFSVLLIDDDDEDDEDDEEVAEQN